MNDSHCHFRLAQLIDFHSSKGIKTDGSPIEFLAISDKSDIRFLGIEIFYGVGFSKLALELTWKFSDIAYDKSLIG